MKRPVKIFTILVLGFIALQLIFDDNLQSFSHFLDAYNPIKLLKYGGKG